MNKKTILNCLSLLLFLVISINVKSQIVDYFANDPQWRQSSEYPNNIHPCFKIENFVYYVSGDTIVDSISYKKIYKRGEVEEVNDDITLNWGCPISYGTFDFLVAIARQEGRKIFLKKYGGGPETLLHDFGGNVGDTIKVSYRLAVVDSIDSLVVGQNYRRISYFHFKGSNEMYWLVEGIGPEYGFLENSPFESFDNLYCYKLKDAVVYTADSTHANNYKCNFDVSLMESKKLNEITAFPNPVRSILSIELKRPFLINEAEAFNAAGQKFTLTFREENSLFYVLNTEKLPIGIYLIRLNEKNGESLELKILKE